MRRFDAGRPEPPAGRLTPEDWSTAPTITPSAAHGGRDLAKGSEAASEIGESLPQGRARDLAHSARRPRRLDRRDAGNPEAGRRTGSVRLRRLDAGQRARGIAPPLRAAPRV